MPRVAPTTLAAQQTAPASAKANPSRRLDRDHRQPWSTTPGFGKGRWTGATAPRLGNDLSRIPVELSRIPVEPPRVVGLQAKLMVNAPGDEDELDADRMAEQVMRMPDPRQQTALPFPVGQTLQPQRRPPSGDGGHSVAPPIVHQTLQSPGQPLDPTTCDWMERRFLHDFSQVRIHADAKAAESARAVNARAYTAGHDVVFGSGQYGPATSVGRQLLAHELTHVVQQAGARPLVMRDGPPLPRSLEHTLDPSTMGRGELDQEILALRDWLQLQTAGTEETDRLQAVLEARCRCASPDNHDRWPRSTRAASTGAQRGDTSTA